MRWMLIAGLLLAGCKDKADKASPKASESAKPAAAPTGADASGDALQKRLAFHAKVQKLVEQSNGDCDKLGPALDPLHDEARAARDAKDKVAPADQEADRAAEKAALTPLLLGTGQCKDTAKVDAFMDVATGVKK